MELDEEYTKCSICVTEFSFDRDNKDPEIRKHLPVLSSSQRCDHWFCHGCILREQLRVAEQKNGRIPKWLKCMHCREKTSFNPAEPKYHRLLIDLLARAQAARVKLEEQEKTTISAGTKRKTPPETAETAPEKSKSKMEEGTSKSDDDDGSKNTATKEGMGRVAAAAGTKRKSLPISDHANGTETIITHSDEVPTRCRIWLEGMYFDRCEHFCENKEYRFVDYNGVIIYYCQVITFHATLHFGKSKHQARNEGGDVFHLLMGYTRSLIEVVQPLGELTINKLLRRRIVRDAVKTSIKNQGLRNAARTNAVKIVVKLLTAVKDEFRRLSQNEHSQNESGKNECSKKESFLGTSAAEKLNKKVFHILFKIFRQYTHETGQMGEHALMLSNKMVQKALALDSL